MRRECLTKKHRLSSHAGAMVCDSGAGSHETGSPEKVLWRKIREDALDCYQKNRGTLCGE